MPESVIDATVVAFANGNLAQMKATSALAARVAVLTDVLNERAKLRVNDKLLNEYCDHVKDMRNDVIESFIALLDTRKYIKVTSNTLRRQVWAVARNAGWPSHDQHLLAAAVGGDECTIFVTEKKHAVCSAKICRNLGVKLKRLA